MMIMDKCQKGLTSEAEKVLKAQLALWSARHALSVARTEAIRLAVLRQAREPDVVPIGYGWWEGFCRGLQSVLDYSLDSDRFLVSFQLY